MKKAIIQVENLVTRFGDNVIHDGINIKVNEGEIYGILGKSGSGKTTLLREMIMLQEPAEGKIEIFGHNLHTLNPENLQALRRQWGILFQFGALFTSLTVAENIAVKLKEYTHISDSLIKDIIAIKLKMVGLELKTAAMYPSELSGGMVKRAAIARALAMDPKLLFLDEPTSGLDPISAEKFDDLIIQLKNLLGLTIVMVTHDIDTIFTIVDRIAVLGDKKVLAEGPIDDVAKSDHPFIREFFGGNRGSMRRRYGK